MEVPDTLSPVMFLWLHKLHCDSAVEDGEVLLVVMKSIQAFAHGAFAFSAPIFVRCVGFFTASVADFGQVDH